MECILVPVVAVVEVVEYGSDVMRCERERERRGEGKKGFFNVQSMGLDG